MNNEEKILLMLESMNQEIKDLRKEMNKRFDEMSVATGDIVTQVGEMFDD